MSTDNRFTLPPLPYPKDALEQGGISRETVQYHYDKHHAGYVRKLNAADEAGKVPQNASLEQLIITTNGAVFNLAAQIYNHTFYWESMAPSSKGCQGSIAKAIQSQFSTNSEFITAFKQRAAMHFGSGWLWLSLNKQLQLVLSDGHDAYNPLRDGMIPLLCIDVWEHAYYVDYRNDRASYIDNFVRLINWEKVQQRYENALKSLKSNL